MCSKYKTINLISLPAIKIFIKLWDNFGEIIIIFYFEIMIVLLQCVIQLENFSVNGINHPSNDCITQAVPISSSSN